MAKESTYSTATPTGTDYVRLIDDPGGTPVTANATVASLSDAMTGAVVYRIWDGMSDAINTVWQNFWAETAKAVLIIEPKASGVYTLNNDNVTCTGSAATAEKYVFGNNQEVYTATGSLLWRGAVGSSNNRVLFIDRLFFSAYDGNADSTGAGLVFQNTNWNHIDVRCKSTKVVVGTHTATGQCEFNWMRFDLQNCDTTSPLHFAAYSSGDGSMRGNQIHARIFGSTSIDNAWRCAMTLYHCNVEIHAGGIGGAGGSPGANPNANYTGANAVFWIENDGSTDAGLHGTRLVLRDERGTGTGKVGLWVEDNGTARRQEHSHIDFASIYAYDYMAVADFPSPSELPRFTFGINQQTQVNSWTADDGTWKIPVMRWDGGRYNITDVPGVFGDGTTDVDALIGSALSNGGAWYFPPGNYHLSTTVAVNHAAGLDVECGPGVLFSTNGETIDGNLFEFDTAVTNNDLVRFRWVGGDINTEGLMNSTSTGTPSFGFLNEGTSAVADAMEFRDGYWSNVHVEGVRIFTKTGAHLEDPASVTRQHYMGDYANGYVTGGDSGIFINSGAEVVLRDITIAGTRGAAVYIANSGNAQNIEHVTADNVNVYWSYGGLHFKDGEDLPYHVRVNNCTAHGCYIGFTSDHQPSSSNEGADYVEFNNCVANIYWTGFLVVEATGVRLNNCRALRGGWQDWAGSYRGSKGSVKLTSGASGSVDSITITGVNGNANILSAAVNFNTDLETTAGLVRDNINAGTGTHGIAASIREDPASAGDWFIYLHTTADGSELNGNTVTSSATTITTTDANMAYHFTACYGLDIEGSVGTVVESLAVDGATLFGFVADSRPITATRVRSLESADAGSGTDNQTLDTLIRNLFVNHVTGVGGEVTVADVTDPDRTVYDGIVYGDTMSSFAAPTLLGAESRVDFKERRVYVKAADETRTSTTTVSAATGWSAIGPLRASATYRVWGKLIISGVDGASAGDFKARWDPSVGSTITDAYWGIQGVVTGATAAAGSVQKKAEPVNQAVTINITADDTVQWVDLEGYFPITSEMTLSFDWAQNASNATATTLHKGSTLVLERIG